MSLYSSIFEQYLSHSELKEVVSDQAFIHRMISFEVALARCQAKLGVIPADAAEAIQTSLNTLTIDPKELAAGTVANGVPTVDLLERCRQKIPTEYRDFLHLGATSQDMIDTATALMMKEASGKIGSLLGALIHSLDNLQQEYGRVNCMLRTRHRNALPGLFGSKVRNWRDPLERHRNKLEALAEPVFKVQLGGPVGDGSTFGSRYEDLIRELAMELGLSAAPAWHVQRDSICEFSGWLAILAGSVGKMGSDIIAMAQDEVGEVSESSSGDGKSSSMPHKQNPVRSEALVAIARIMPNLQAQMIQTLLHEAERDGSAMIQEWITLPQMILLTGCTLEHGLALAREIKLNVDVMERNVKHFQDRHRPNN